MDVKEQAKAHHEILKIMSSGWARESSIIVTDLLAEVERLEKMNHVAMLANNSLNDEVCKLSLECERLENLSEERMTALLKETDRVQESWRENEQLKKWKAETLQVERQWDIQEVGKLIECQLGDNIRTGIAPYIKDLQAQLSRYEKLEPLWVGQNEENYNDNMKLSKVNQAQFEKIITLKKQLSRYANAVEVEGVSVVKGTYGLGVSIMDVLPKELIGQRVRVLVMPAEVGE